jgi:protein involved in polysaccharide export with SLBB domain
MTTATTQPRKPKLITAGLRTLALGGALLAAAGCSAYTPVGAPNIRDNPLPQPQSVAYRMVPGDLLSIKFYGNPELNEDVPIRPDGAISLAYIGDVPVAGLTPGELDSDLTRRYTGELARPRVTVVVREFGNQRVYVGGEVGKPGVIAMKGSLTLMQALQEAGSLTPSSRRQQVVLIRTTADGKRIGRTIDIRPLVSGAEPGMDVPLQALDVVFVPRTRISNVDLFVEQYIRQLLPITPGLGFYLGPNNNGSSSSH